MYIHIKDYILNFYSTGNQITPLHDFVISQTPNFLEINLLIHGNHNIQKKKKTEKRGKFNGFMPSISRRESNPASPAPELTDRSRS